jgi:hypothetical protein
MPPRRIRVPVAVTVAFITAASAVLVAVIANRKDTPKDPDKVKPATIVFTSDTTWLASTIGPSKWSSVKFDDSSWQPAQVVRRSVTLTAFDSAPVIWSRSQADTCYLRGELRIPKDQFHSFQTARVEIYADDDFRLWVNGRKISTSQTPGTDITPTFDIYSQLEPGPNLIAIMAWNTEGAGRGVALTITVK